MAVARERAVAVAVARGGVVGVAVAPEQVPLFVHQLSLPGLNGEFGGQSRFAGMGAMAVYLELLKTTDVPEA